VEAASNEGLSRCTGLRWLRPSVLIDKMPVTSLCRTVLDLARALPMIQAVTAGDRALALVLTRNALEASLVAMARWPGVRAARRTCHGRSRNAKSSDQTSG
jgi:hypothetical protein